METLSGPEVLQSKQGGKCSEYDGSVRVARTFIGHSDARCLR